ncbi:menaquinol-cytochrome c reductase cytochrome c1 subunit precursor [Knoellia remsis]|uniref:Cytochrome bc1 complex cytochrome c subunit n=1 Tax=Knoellia remsis TaxID=407159 RepID=A0A2T0UXL0_9MICO|nr:c-type cytochrome [Knoellia remsis]PRY62661.1 menaquinol-cytochrome c reductase cytochrome c1 subunit precursor [Knoellia remsis]
MNALAARRRHPAAIALLLLLGLLVTGFAYAAVAPQSASAEATTAEQVEKGKQLFRANCASCHGVNAEGRKTGIGDQIAGPALAGVGAAAVDFQMGTGRMPMRAPSQQAPRATVEFNQEQIDAIGAYIASLAPGPGVPSAEDVDPAKGDPAAGGELFRVNCAMCHNFAGSGGALTRGKYAPSLMNVEPKHIYEAMETGPQSMPVFNDNNLDPESKRDIIAFLKSVENTPSQGGHQLGALGPVTEGWFAWVFGLGVLIAAAVWLGQKSA